LVESEQVIKGYQEIEHLIREHEKKHPLTLEQRFAIAEGLYREARLLGHFSSHAVDKNIEPELRMSKILNANVPDSPRRNP